mgnify:CR=1 FL=1
MVGKKGKEPSETPRCTRCRKRRPLHKWFGVTPGSYGRDHEACARCSHCHRSSQCSVCELWTVEDLENPVLLQALCLGTESTEGPVFPTEPVKKVPRSCHPSAGEQEAG